MKVLVDYEKLLNLFDVDKDLFGSQGFCLVKGKKIFKIYFNPCENVCDLSNYKSKKISFPIHYLYNQNNLSSNMCVGEIMPYYNKKQITWSLNEKTIIDLLVKHYFELRKEIDKFPEILMDDLCTANILYNDENGFSIIDTTTWDVDKNKDFSQYNKMLFDFEVCERIVDGILNIMPKTITDYEFYHNIKKYGSLGISLFNALESTLNDKYELLNILNLLQEIANKYSLEPIKTLGDAQNYIKKLKNC